MEVSFLVVFFAGFLAYFDSVKVCADHEEVPTANWKGWIPVEGSTDNVILLTLSVQMVKNDSVTSAISAISVWQVGIGWIQPREYSYRIS